MSAPEQPDLRQRIAQALMSWGDRNNNPAHAALRQPATVTANAYSRADAVLAVVEPELAALRAQLADAEQRAEQWEQARDLEVLATARVFDEYYRRWQSTIVEARRQAARADAAEADLAIAEQHIEQGNTETNKAYAQLRSALASRPACPDPIECGHEAAPGQAKERVALLEAGASERQALLEEARDALEAAGQNGAHGDDWPAIAPAIQALAAENERLRALFADAHHLACHQGEPRDQHSRCTREGCPGTDDAPTT